MENNILDKNFKAVVLNNLVLKSKIMASIFGVIFFLQAFMMFWFMFYDPRVYEKLNSTKVILAPLLMLVGILLELYFVRYFNYKIKSENELNVNKVILVSFVHISFPTIVLWSAISILEGIRFVGMSDMLSSPPLLMYFILISLSSFALNPKINLYSGIVAAIQYGAIVLYFGNSELNTYELRFTLIRCLLMVIAGVVTGSFTKIFMEAVNSSIKSKDDLIQTLDIKVNERTKELNEKKIEVEEKNKEILDSINYAQGLQIAILPNEEKLNAYFKEQFILYKPKDIVAGDFYWLEERAGKIWFAVCDCTGHGVPGAMVSLVCSNALSQALAECLSDKACEVLDLVKQKVVTTFSKQGIIIKDGMDAVLCCFDFDAMHLNFAAANNSLYHLRSDVLNDSGADKIPVGKSENSKNYTYKEINLQRGDFIYLTTDGFPDQFGGPLSANGGKKFKYKPLKEILGKNRNLSAYEQKLELENAFNNWKGNLEQVDDVCIAGILI